MSLDPLAPPPLSLFQELMMTSDAMIPLRPRPAAPAAPRRPARRIAAAAFTALVRVVATLETWQRRRRERRCLDYLGDHMLKDLGISRADADREAGKPAWRD